MNDTTYTFTYQPTGPNTVVALTGPYADIAGNAGTGYAARQIGSAAPRMVGATSSRTIDEDANNTGRIIYFNGAGLGVAAGTATSNALTISDADNHDFAGGALRVHLDSRIAVPNVAGEVLGIRGLGDGSYFFRAVGDDIYFRQGTTVSGVDGVRVANDGDASDDILIGSIATIGGVRLDGAHGADLVINLNQNATPAITQLLAANVTFGVRLANGETTQAWQNFAGTASAVFTLHDGQGNAATVSRPLSVVAQNDAPIAAADSHATLATATTAISGNLLANDTDPDNVAGLAQQTLSVVDLAFGATHATLTGGSMTLLGAHGSLTLNASTGVYSYALNPNDPALSLLATGQSVVETFTYRISDGAAQSEAATLSIRIDGASANVAPVASPDRASASPTGAASGNLVANDTDANGQALHVSAVALGGPFVSVPATGVVTLQGAYGVLTLSADGAYTYAPDATVAHLPAFKSLVETFAYTVDDGAGGVATSSLTAEIVNAPFRISGPAGTVKIWITDAAGARIKVIDTLTLGDAPLAWNPNFSPSDGAAYVEIEGGAISVLGGAPVTQLTLKVVAVADLPPTAAGDTSIYMIHDTRAHVEAADQPGSVLRALLNNHQLLGVISKDGGAQAGATPYETYGASQIGVIAFDPQIALPTGVLQINEDANPNGFLLAFNGTGLGVADGQGNAAIVGAQVGSPYGVDLAGGSLLAHIDHPQGVAGVGGEYLFLRESNGLFRTDAQGRILWRQDARISGATSENVTQDMNMQDDVIIGQFMAGPNFLLNGQDGHDLQIMFNENATGPLVQLLVSEIGFGIGLANHTGTQGWENFIPPQDVQQSVTFTLKDVRGAGASATRLVTPVAVNDAPVAVADTAAILASGTATGNLLSNDSDPDNIAGLAAANVLTVVGAHGATAAGDASVGASTVIAGRYGSLTLSANGAYSYAPDASNGAVAGLTGAQTLSDVFAYTVSDGHGGTASSTLSVTVAAASIQPPQASNPVLIMPGGTRTMDEDANNSGRVIAFSGAGLGVYAESADSSAVGVVVSGGSPAGDILTAQIANRVGVSGVAGEVLFVRTSTDLFRIEDDGRIYFRQDTQVSGRNNFVLDGQTYQSGVPILVDANPADDILIGQLRSDGAGALLDGKQGRALSIALSDDATAERVQVLINNIGFGIRLAGGDYTEAWGPFASTSRSVNLSLTNANGDVLTTGARQFSIVSHNDAPVAHQDFAAMGHAQASVSGGVLANDDPDILPNQGANSIYLPAGLAVTSVSHGVDAGIVGSALTGAYGSLTLNGNGAYTYALDTSRVDVQALTSGALTDVFHYTMTDGTAASGADLTIVIDALGAHWGSSNKVADTANPVAETIFRHAAADEVRIAYGFDGNDVLGAAGAGLVTLDGGAGDDIMVALAAHTVLKGGAGADRFVIGSADIDVRIEDMSVVATKDTLDLSHLFVGMAQGDIDAFLSANVSEGVDSVTGRTSTLISFNGLGGEVHSGHLLIAGVTLDQAYNEMQTETAATNYPLLDELRLIAANHG